MAKSKRNHFPCRVCGKEHTNPSSSTICTKCGPKERQRNLDIKEELRALQQECLDRWDDELLSTEIL